MTFEDIRKANSEIKTLPLGRKQYAEVAERVVAFRKLYPEGQILTELIKYDDTVVIFKATITNGVKGISDNEAMTLATGWAKEVEGSSNINRTSAIENCETSAVGRALGFLGLTGGGTIASYEEVSNARLQQEAVKLATNSEKAGLIASARAKGLEVESVLRVVGFDRDKQPEGMTREQYAKAMEYINAQPD